MSSRFRAIVSSLIKESFQALLVTVALTLIGVLLIYNGTIDLPSIDQTGQNWIMVTCLAGGTMALVLAALTVTGRLGSQTELDLSMTAGLTAAVACNAITGAVWPEGLWIVCGYTMVLLISAGATLRNDYLFAVVVLLATISWFLVSGTSDPRMEFPGDANTLVLVGTLISIAIFVALRIERHLQQGLTGELRDQADHDPLTGALNRNGLLAGISVLEGLSSDGSLWCAYLDVDYFKSINDRRGHDQGDEGLKAIVDELERVVGRAGLVARWGGDEFVILANGTDPGAAFIEQQVDSSLAARGIQASVSIGVTSTRWTPGLEVPELIELADREMYARRDLDRAAGHGAASLS